MRRQSVIAKKVGKIDVEFILKKKGWFVRERQSSGYPLWNRLLQWTPLLCGWILAIKTFAIVFLIDDDSEWNHYLGDFSPGMRQKKIYVETIYFQFITVTNMIWFNLIIHQLFDLNGNKFFVWLQIYRKDAEIENRIQSNDVEAENITKCLSRFWKRVKVTMKISQFVINSSTIGYICLTNYVIYKSLPEEYYFTFALVNSLIFDMAVPSAMSIFLTTICVIIHVCHHLSIRFELVQSKFFIFLEDKNRITNRNLLNHKLVLLLRKHNKVCRDLHRFNHFWKNYFAIKYILHPLGIQLCAYVTFFASIDIAGRLIFFTAFMIQFICLTIDCLSASAVHKKAHSCYQILNRISLDKRLSLNVKIKLNNYIQRLDGKSLAFTSLNMFNVTYASYFYFVSEIASHFIVLLDVIMNKQRILAALSPNDSKLQP